MASEAQRETVPFILEKVPEDSVETAQHCPLIVIEASILTSNFLRFTHQSSGARRLKIPAVLKTH